ncbi:MAG: S-methyl-5'-thioadenosine phosphorylase [Actinobacteria bacterium]|nr:S-methyl-5'-thioadenosine phosphorylase [Actinomycetota bacterium]MBM3712843.1 S-methyl-5'-thioadenosine phosphorylase [Actinomycetota bacterium]
MQNKSSADVGVFGGSGFYNFLKIKEEIEVNTPYGMPSDKIIIGELEGLRVAFLPRHGKHHNIPPHKINYRANVFAMKKIGVKQIFAPCAAGSLQPHIKRGDFVIVDQFVDRTNCRNDTYYDGPHTTHISTAEPYCTDLRNIVIDAAKELGISYHPKGTVVVIQGPRFSTKSESIWYSNQGWEVINMTQYPEVALSRELQVCYVNISLITDYDTGLESFPDIKPVSSQEIIKILKENNDRLRGLLFKAVPKVPKTRKCICSNALDGAIIS